MFRSREVQRKWPADNVDRWFFVIIVAAGVLLGALVLQGRAVLSGPSAVRPHTEQTVIPNQRAKPD